MKRTRETRELVSGASGPSPIALEFDEFGEEEEEPNGDSEASLARHEAPRKRKAGQKAGGGGANRGGAKRKWRRG